MYRSPWLAVAVYALASRSPPESARVLHIDVRLDGPQKNGAERSERPPTPPATQPTLR
jgi:hypothetical protein